MVSQCEKDTIAENFGALLVHSSLQMRWFGAKESAVNASKHMNGCEYKQGRKS